MIRNFLIFDFFFQFHKTLCLSTVFHFSKYTGSWRFWSFVIRHWRSSKTVFWNSIYSNLYKKNWKIKMLHSNNHILLDHFSWKSEFLPNWLKILRKALFFSASYWQLKSTIFEVWYLIEPIKDKCIRFKMPRNNAYYQYYVSEILFANLNNFLRHRKSKMA